MKSGAQTVGIMPGLFSYVSGKLPIMCLHVQLQCVNHICTRHTTMFTDSHLHLETTTIVHGSAKWLLLRLRFQHKRVLNHIGEIPLATLPYMAVA